MISEHPLGFGSIARLAALAHESGIRTAGAETIAGTDQAQVMCAGKLYDVLMPDIKYAGGFTGMLAIAGVCADHGVAFAPHNPTGPIAHLASIHACAAAPTLLWLEPQWNQSRLLAALVGGPKAPPANDGGVRVARARPGAGAATRRGARQPRSHL